MRVRSIWIVVSLCLAMLSMTASDCDGPRDIRPSFVASIVQLQPVWSPDGSTIVFPYGQDLYSITSDGSTLKLIVREKEQIISPDISPDGARVVYASFKKGTFWDSGDYWEIKVVNINGSSKRALGRSSLEGKNQPYDINPSWSPDGHRIAFVSNRSEEGFYQIYAMAADGSDVRRVASTVLIELRSPKWSPDGQRLAFKGLGEIGEDYQTTGYTGYEYAYVIQIDGSDLKNLGQTWTQPEWSPDGSSVVFMGSEDNKRSILAAARDGSGYRNLTDEVEHPPSHTPFEYLSWSVDGTKLLHSIHDYTFPHYNAYVINLKQQDVLRGKPSTTRIGKGVGSWSPDNSRIAIHTRTYPRLFTVLPDGSDRRVLVAKGKDRPISGYEWQEVEKTEAASTPNP